MKKVKAKIQFFIKTKLSYFSVEINKLFDDLKKDDSENDMDDKEAEGKIASKLKNTNGDAINLLGYSNNDKIINSI